MNKQHKMILNVLVWLIVIASLISLTSVLVFATGAECKINISYKGNCSVSSIYVTFLNIFIFSN